MADEWYANNTYVHKAFIEDMTSAGTWFYKLFPKASDYNRIWKLSPARKNSIWEAKRLVDAIESGKYKQFIDRDIH